MQSLRQFALLNLRDLSQGNTLNISEMLKDQHCRNARGAMGYRHENQSRTKLNEQIGRE
jgi:hypothetical protein